MTTHSDIVDQVLAQYRQQLVDYEQYWYLGNRFEYHPIAGYVLAPYTSATLNISNQGFRGPEYNFRKVHDNPRIAVFGPSALVGIPNSSDDTTITSFMERSFQSKGVNAEIMNFGVICGRINNEMRMISKFLIDYDIDAVVLLSGYNDGWSFAMGSLWEFQDITDIHLRGFEANRHADKPLYFLKQAWNAWLRKQVVAKARRASRKNFRGAEKFFRNRRATDVDRVQPVPVFDTGERIYLQFLQQIVSACNYAGKPFYYIFQPNIFTSSKPLSPYENAAKETMENAFGQNPSLQRARIEQFRQFYFSLGEKTKSLVTEIGGHVIDADACFSAMSSDKEVFFDECHYREVGNEAIAVIVANEIMKALPQ